MRFTFPTTPGTITLWATTAGIALLLAGGANATPMQLTLTAVDLTNPATFSTTYSDVALGGDTVTPESSPNAIIIPAVVLGAINFSVANSMSLTGGLLNSLVSSALNVTNTSTTDTYRITGIVSGRNFAGPVNFVALTGSGTWLTTPGSIMSLAFYDSPSNVLGASTSTDTPGNLLGTFTSAPADLVTSSYAYSPGSTPLGISDTGLFSMTESWSYTLDPGGSLVSRGQTESKALSTAEPASMLLFGTGLTGVALAARRKKTARATVG